MTFYDSIKRPTSLLVQWVVGLLLARKCQTWDYITLLYNMSIFSRVKWVEKQVNQNLQNQAIDVIFC